MFFAHLANRFEERSGDERFLREPTENFSLSNWQIYQTVSFMLPSSSLSRQKKFFFCPKFGPYFISIYQNKYFFFTNLFILKISTFPFILFLLLCHSIHFKVYYPILPKYYISPLSICFNPPKNKSNYIHNLNLFKLSINQTSLPLYSFSLQPSIKCKICIKSCYNQIRY